MALTAMDSQLGHICWFGDLAFTVKGKKPK